MRRVEGRSLIWGWEQSQFHKAQYNEETVFGWGPWAEHPGQPALPSVLPSNLVPRCKYSLRTFCSEVLSWTEPGLVPGLLGGAGVIFQRSFNQGLTCSWGGEEQPQAPGSAIRFPHFEDGNQSWDILCLLGKNRMLSMFERWIVAPCQTPHISLQHVPPGWSRGEFDFPPDGRYSVPYGPNGWQWQACSADQEARYPDQGLLVWIVISMSQVRDPMEQVAGRMSSGVDWSESCENCWERASGLTFLDPGR